MITLEQIRELNEKVLSLLEAVRSFKEENSKLRGQLEENRVQVRELESLVASLKGDQEEIEGIIRDILLQLGKSEVEFSATKGDTLEQNADSTGNSGTSRGATKKVGGGSPATAPPLGGSSPGEPSDKFDAKEPQQDEIEASVGGVEGSDSGESSGMELDIF